MTTTRILLLRHAEKTGDIADIHLSAAGAARAAALADFIPAAFGVPQILKATAQSKHSRRPIETLYPLAIKLGDSVPFAADYPDDAYGALARDLLSDTRYQGALTVVCWHHGKLPQLAQALGAPAGTYPAPWDEAVFNLILDLTYPGGPVPMVQTVTMPF